MFDTKFVHVPTQSLSYAQPPGYPIVFELMPSGFCDSCVERLSLALSALLLYSLERSYVMALAGRSYSALSCTTNYTMCVVSQGR